MLKYLLFFKILILPIECSISGTFRVSSQKKFNFPISKNGILNTQQKEQLTMLGFTFTEDFINDFLKDFNDNWTSKERLCIIVFDDSMNFMISDLPKTITTRLGKKLARLNGKELDSWNLGLWLDEKTSNNTKLRRILINGILKAQQKDVP